MSLRGLVVATALCGCGPDIAASAGESSGGGSSSTEEELFSADWAVGRWSTNSPETSGDTSIVYLDIRPDGTMTETRLSQCGATSESSSLLWSASGPKMIEVTELDGAPKGGLGVDSVQFVFEDVCEGSGNIEWIDTVLSVDGEEAIRRERSYLRGNVCLHELSPPVDDDVVEADSCWSNWCDGGPPPPLECFDG